MNQEFRAAFKKLSLPPAEGEIIAQRDHRGWWKQVVKETIGPTHETFPFDHYFEELWELFARPQLWRVYPEAVEVLQELSSHGYRLAVLSNWDERLHHTLEGLELTPHFEHRLVSSDLGFEKPQAQIYQHAVQKLGIKPEEALMVGDEPMNDYWAPRSQGWHSVLIERPEQDLRSVLNWLGLGK